jgi:hypothetical protein
MSTASLRRVMDAASMLRPPPRFAPECRVPD